MDPTSANIAIEVAERKIEVFQHSLAQYEAEATLSNNNNEKQQNTKP